MALAGKGEIRRHFNTITDYTLFWLISFYDYYRYTGDLEFLGRWQRRFTQVLDFCLSRTDENGLLISPRGEWVFIDWNDALTKDSECYAFLQILLYGALKAAKRVYALLGNGRAAACEARAEALKEQIFRLFWCEEKGGFTHSLLEGKSDGRIFRQINVMAVLTGLAGEHEKEQILHRVLLNETVPPITTSYMRFYEFAALCELGQKALVAEEMRSYFCGMLSLGATTFWEQYDPTRHGAEHYAMYGRKYGKSLCHAWGATQIYILGRYLVGLRPEEDGYDRFRLEPALEVLGDFSAKFPLKEGGWIEIDRKGQTLRVLATRDGSVLLGDTITEIQAGRETVLALDQKKGGKK